MKTIILVSLIVLCWTLAPVQAAHEFPYYPSFYPQEIRIETVAPEVAATRLPTASLHAYIGPVSAFQQEVPRDVATMESLASYLVLTFPPDSKGGRPEARCTSARTLLSSLAAQPGSLPGSFVFHPYPVTPYHMDYLSHFDRIEQAKQVYQQQEAGNASPSLRVQPRGELASQLVQAMGQPAAGAAGEAILEEISLQDLLFDHTYSFNGWLGPPWYKEGWFHAYLLWAGLITDQERKQRVDTLYRRLIYGDYQGLADRINVERALVAELTRGCERVMVGYTMRHEYYNTEYSAGVENIAVDALAGFYSPVFLRTIKLKDFLWNGWLRLGINARPRAAWNPIGGFSDRVGRLVWFGIGDPAFLPSPTSSIWLPNRIRADTTVEGAPPGGVPVPRDAVIPEPGTGILQPVGTGKKARTKITYRVLTSTFHDTTRMSVADLLYPYIFAFRWSSTLPGEEGEYDPLVARASALIRERLVGVKVIRVDREVKNFADIRVVQDIPVIEVYVDYATIDPLQVASLAPPWSPLPWHLIVLMEEAVKRGWAAFSQQEAQRRGVPWLDLVRDEQIKAKLASLVATFARQGYVPPALQDLVTVGEAQKRWRALQRFFEQYEHFLVTCGPYRLKRGSERVAVLEAFRDFTYPLGIGAFDKYVFPPRAVDLQVALHSNEVTINAKVHKTEKAMRSYITTQEPLQHSSLLGIQHITAVAAYRVIDADGMVRLAGTSQAGEGNVFSIKLAPLPSGVYTLLTALYLNENYVAPEVHRIEYRVKGDS